MLCPVIISAKGEQKNNAADAMSSGRINLPSGMSPGALFDDRVDIGAGLFGFFFKNLLHPFGLRIARMLHS